MLFFVALSSRILKAHLAFFGAFQVSLKPQGFVHSIISCQAIYTNLPYPSLSLSPSNPHQPPHPHPPPLPTIQLGPHIQIKRQPAPPPPIKINHILHPVPRTTPLHHPIMPIERRLVPPQPQPPRPRTHAPAVPRETPQLGPAAARVGRGGEAAFPRLDLGPGALVDGVVDGHDGGHVGGGGVVVFAPHGVEEHLFRRVDPV